MSREWGIYPENCEPTQWWGARALIEGGRMVLLFDRQNYEQGDKATDTDKGDMFAWMQNTMDPAIQEQVKRGFFRKWEDVFTLDSESGRFHCEATTKNSGGAYLYIGVWEVPYVKAREDFGIPDEVLDFKRDIELASDVFEIEELIGRLSDGVAEDVLIIELERALENTADSLAYLKNAVVTAMDLYLEENEWDGDPDYGQSSKYYAVMKHPDTGKEVVTSGWDVSGIRDWVKLHDEQGYVLVSCDLGLDGKLANAAQTCEEVNKDVVAKNDVEIEKE